MSDMKLIVIQDPKSHEDQLREGYWWRRYGNGEWQPIRVFRNPCVGWFIGHDRINHNEQQPIFKTCVLVGPLKPPSPISRSVRLHGRQTVPMTLRVRDDLVDSAVGEVHQLAPLHGDAEGA
jgi:hypothetical protein